MKRWFGFLAFALLTLIVLLVDLRPATPVSSPPSAADAQAGQALLQQVEAARDRDTLYGWTSLDSAVRLAAQFSGQSRMAIDAPAAKQHHLTILSSRALGAHMWLNARLTVHEGKGFPPIALTLGSVTLPEDLSRWIMERALERAQRTYPGLPPLNQIVRDVRIMPQGVQAKLDLPVSTLLAQQGGAHLRARALACQTMAALPASKPIALDQLLNTAFARAPADAETNSQLLAQLTLIASPAEAARFFPAAGAIPPECGLADRTLTLQGREDLARHWLMSASLTARFGAQLSNALGFWKELSDSAPKGSGFSFVDLAADCSGMMWGARLVTDETAASAATALGKISADTLLPPQALTLDEGLSEAEFTKRYGSITHLRCARDLRHSMAQR